MSLDSTRLTHPSEGAEGGGLTLPVPAAAGARAACVRLTCAVPAAPPAKHGARKTASLQPPPGPRGWIGIPQGGINTDHLPLQASFFLNKIVHFSSKRQNFEKLAARADPAFPGARRRRRRIPVELARHRRRRLPLPGNRGEEPPHPSPAAAVPAAPSPARGRGVAGVVIFPPPSPHPPAPDTSPGVAPSRCVPVVSHPPICGRGASLVPSRPTLRWSLPGAGGSRRPLNRARLRLPLTASPGTAAAAASARPKGRGRGAAGLAPPRRLLHRPPARYSAPSARSSVSAAASPGSGRSSPAPFLFPVPVPSLGRSELAAVSQEPAEGGDGKRRAGARAPEAPYPPPPVSAQRGAAKRVFVTGARLYRTGAPRSSRA